MRPQAIKAPMLGNTMPESLVPNDCIPAFRLNFFFSVAGVFADLASKANTLLSLVYEDYCNRFM